MPERVCKCRTFILRGLHMAYYEDGFIHTIDCCPSVRLRELTDDLIEPKPLFDHISIVPFIAICGADVPNQSTTQNPANALCSVCRFFWAERFGPIQ